LRLLSTLRTSAILLCLASLVVLTSCAYRMGAGDRQLPAGYKAIAVPVFKNRTHEAGIEVYFTNAMVRELERSRTGRVSDKANSQVTLEGVIDSVNYLPGNPVTSPKYNLPSNTILNTEYRMILKTTISLVRNSDQKVLWSGSFEGERSYLTPRIGNPTLSSANATYNYSARYQSIQDIAQDLMSQAHDRLTENF
jgi:hypothetical protein